MRTEARAQRRSSFGTRVAPLFAGLVLVLICSACGDDLPKATLITHMRMVGGRTEVKGDEMRSTPKPGETAVVTFAMAYPKVDQDDSVLSSMFITCSEPKQFTGTPICQELIDLATKSGDAGAGTGAGAAELPKSLSCKGLENSVLPPVLPGVTASCVSGTPKIDVAIEAKSKLAKKLIRGIICRNGTPAINLENEQLFECHRNAGVKASDYEELAVYGTVPIEHDADSANQNPSFSDATLKRRTKVWPAEATPVPATDDDCLDASMMGLMPLTDGRDEEIVISYPASVREKRDGKPETIELSAYATAGELDRRFIVFETDAKAVGGKLENSWKWKLTSDERLDIKKTGKLVRFIFTILDREGGFDVTQRSLCVQK